MRLPLFFAYLLCVLSPDFAKGEGTKEFWPDQTQETRVLIARGTISGQQRDPFAVYNGAEDYRLYIHISDPLTENIYFGIGQRNGGTVAANGWRVHRPDGSVIFQASIPTTGQGFISTYDQAIRGPDDFDPLGYDANVIALGPGFPSGDYFMTFEVSNNTSRTFLYLDITVANPATSMVYNGRVFSKNWQFSNPQDLGGDFPVFKGQMYIYSLDGIVTKLNPNGFEGRDFSFACNESGCFPIGPTVNAQQARQSQITRSTYPQFKIFLNNPDPAVYPDGIIGQLVPGSVTTETFCNTGLVNFSFQTMPVNAVGTVEIILSLSTLSPPLVDRILVTNNVPGGLYTITWDGLDGAGTQVPSGSTFPFTLRYTNGLTHMPLWDVEKNVNGFLVTLIRPVTVPPLADPAFYWDDTKTGVGGGSMINPPGCTVPPASSCHAWGVAPYPGDWGNQKTINTWWYLVSNSAENVNLTYKKGPLLPIVINPPPGGCPGNPVTFTVATDPNSAQYRWTWPWGTQVTTNPTITITIPLSAAAGTFNMDVNGINADCGNGPALSIPFTVYAIPTVTVTGDNMVCQNEVLLYTTQSGMMNYNWSVSGGTLVSASGSVATVSWPNTGSHSVSVNYMNLSGCTPASPTVFPVTVNAPPVPAIGGNSSVCEGTTGVVYSTAAGNLNYSWSISAGGTITSGGGPADASVTVTWNTPGPQSVAVGYTDAITSCTSASPTIYAVTVKPLPVPGIIGQASPCAGSTGNSYFTESGKSGYSWVVSAGGTITGGGTASDPSVTVTWNTPGLQQVTVNYTEPSTQCQAAAPSFLPVTVNALPVPSLSGPSSACVNNPGPVYTTEAGQNGYTWSIVPPSAGTITSGANSNAAAVTWTSTGNFSVAVNYTDPLTGCSAAQSSLFPVTVNTLPVPTISGDDQPCTGLPKTYTTQSGPSAYSWVVSSGGTIVAGGGINDPTVTVVWNTPGASSVSVNYTIGTGCTALVPTVFNVTVNQSTAISVTGNQSVCEASSATYSTQPGMSNYTWTLSPGGAFTGGTSGNSVSVLWSSAGARYVDVNFTNTFGCTAPVPLRYPVTVNPLPTSAITESAGPTCTQTPKGYQTLADPECTYAWTIIPGSAGIVSSGQGTHSVTVNWSLPGTATLQLTGTKTITGCNTTTTLPVTAHPLPEPLFSACFDTKTTSQAKRFTLRGVTPWLSTQGVISGSRVSFNNVTGFYEFDPFGAGPGAYNLTYTYTNNYGCSATTPPVTIQVMNNSFTCGGDLTDVRDGRKYKTALIGSRCWMKENLNYGTIVDPASQSQTDNCLPEKYCLPSDANCSAYGGLYQWDELMAYRSTSQDQGLCPPEWHVPTETEWQAMINAISAGNPPPADGVAGSFIKDALLNPGFYALTRGLYYLNNAWSFSAGSGILGTMYWTSTSDGADRAVARGANNLVPSVAKYPGARANAFSVRCVRD